jgi:immune inhibitor A
VDSLRKIYRLNIDGSYKNEYFLVENRQQVNFDSFLPGNGLLIWHVNEDNAINKFPNSSPDHLFLTLKQADGKKELEERTLKFNRRKTYLSTNDNEGNPNDTFPGLTNNRNFDENSNPNTNSYSGKKSHVYVKSISDSNYLMSAEMG